MSRTQTISKSEVTRQRILQAAAELIGAQGFQSTRIETILERSGVSKGNFYHHFDSKEDLGLAVVDYCGVEVREYLQSSMEAFDDPLDQLDAMFDAVVGVTSGRECRVGCPMGNLAAEMSDFHEGFRTQLRRFFQSWQKMVADRLGEAALRHGRSEVDPEALAWHLICGIEGSVLLSKVSREIADLGNSISFLKRYMREQFT